VSLIVNNAAVVGEAASLRGHDDPTVSPGTGGPGSRRIGDILRDTVCRIQQVVHISTPVEPRPLNVHPAAVRLGAEALGSHVHLGDAAGVRDHILVELDVVGIRVAEIQVSLTVIVNEDGWVDEGPVRSAERLSQSVLEGADRGVRHGHADSTSAAVFRHDGNVHIELSVTLDTLSCPGGILAGPLKGRLRQYSAVVSPVLHIRGREALPVGHDVVLSAVSVVAGVHIEHAVIHKWSRVRGVAGLDERVVRPCCRRS